MLILHQLLFSLLCRNESLEFFVLDTKIQFVVLVDLVKNHLALVVHAHEHHLSLRLLLLPNDYDIPDIDVVERGFDIDMGIYKRQLLIYWEIYEEDGHLAVQLL